MMSKVEKKTVEIFGRKYQIEVYRRKQVRASGVSLIMPCYNGLALTQVAVECVRKFTSTPYELWIVDNASNEEVVEWLKAQEDINVILNRTGTHNLAEDGKNWWEINYGGSVANAVGLELGLMHVQTDWAFTTHNDSLPCSPGWLEKVLSKVTDQVRGVSMRKDPSRVHAMHQSCMLFDVRLFHELNLTFLPKMPEYDVGDQVSLGLWEAGYETYFFRNSFNSPKLLEEEPLRSHWLHEIYCDKAVDDQGEPFYLHLGRGTLQTSAPDAVERKTTVEQWCDILRAKALGTEAVPRQHVSWLDNRCNSLRRWFVDDFSFRYIGSLLPGTRILNVGGHKGRHRGQFNIEAYGYDITCLNITADKGTDVVADAALLPFEDESYDVVFCSEVFEHLFDPRPALREACRVLKPGGQIVACTPFLFREHGDPYDFGRYTGSYWKQACETAGFEPMVIENQGTLRTVVVDWLRQWLSYRCPKAKTFWQKRQDTLLRWMTRRVLEHEQSGRGSNDNFEKAFMTGVGVVARKPERDSK